MIFWYFKKRFKYLSFLSTSQEKNYKFYNQQLEYFVGKYYDIEKMIPKALEPLLMPLNDAVLATFQPGISILTWDNVNVDGYLHQVSFPEFNFSSKRTKVQTTLS